MSFGTAFAFIMFIRELPRNSRETAAIAYNLQSIINIHFTLKQKNIYLLMTFYRPAILKIYTKYALFEI